MEVPPDLLAEARDIATSSSITIVHRVPVAVSDAATSLAM